MRKVTIGLFFVGLIVGLSTGGISGTVAQHYAQNWAFGDWGDIDYKVRDGMPNPFNSNTAEAEFRAAASTWNNITGSALDLLNAGQVPANYSLICGTYSSVPMGEAYSTGCPISYVGFAWCQLIDGERTRCLTSLDTTPSGFSWHISSSTSVPAGRIDSRSAMAHELGHAAGASEIDVNCLLASTAQTMCPEAFLSSDWGRVPAAHESNDFATAY